MIYSKNAFKEMYTCGYLIYIYARFNEVLNLVDISNQISQIYQLTSLFKIGPFAFFISLALKWCVSSFNLGE